MNKLERFIEDNFNDETVSHQIQVQRTFIKRYENEIERLQSLKEEQASKPWYEWDGIKFEHSSFSNCDGYRSHHNGTHRYKNYEEFVAIILIETDPEINSYSRNDDSDFTIYSPSGTEYLIDNEKLKEMHLIKEYYEREELKKKIEKYEKEMKELTDNINYLQSEIEKSDKYTNEYVSHLQGQQNDLKKVYNIKEEEYKNESGLERIKDLDNLLINIDKKLNE